jgi:hypothetical protein
MTHALKSWVGTPRRGRTNGNDPFDVQTVQKLLNSAGTRLLLPAIRVEQTDGEIDEITIEAIRRFQQYVVGFRTPDGRIDVGGRSWRKLLESAGEVDTNPSSWPARPAFNALSRARRTALFSDFQYEVNATASDPDAITILGNWQRNNISRVAIPQLARLERPSHTGQQFHRLAATQFRNLWKAWEDAGLLAYVLTFNGAFVPRFQRGTARIANVSALSNHSWGTAFDINAQWNRLGQTPAIISERGCVFELVSLANDHGFFWGGHFNWGRVDGMHFEVARIV